MKTLAVILNHNLPDYTDMLYESLKPYERNDYDLVVLDNGSTPEGASKYTAYKSDTNVYFGGGFQAASDIVLNSVLYDSLLFLNNDLTVFGPEFVRTLKEAMYIEECHVVSPCFFNIEPTGQCHWKTMHNWGHRSPRHVPFVDLQAPLIHRDMLKALGRAGEENFIGWGIDAYIAIIARRNNWKMAVLDYVSMLHHNSLTVKKGVAGMTMQQYCQRAEESQRDFFLRHNLVREFLEVRQLGEAYVPTK